MQVSLWALDHRSQTQTHNTGVMFLDFLCSQPCKVFKSSLHLSSLIKCTHLDLFLLLFFFFFKKIFNRDIGPRLVTWAAGYGSEVWRIRSGYASEGFRCFDDHHPHLISILDSIWFHSKQLLVLVCDSGTDLVSLTRSLDQDLRDRRNSSSPSILSILWRIAERL